VTTTDTRTITPLYFFGPNDEEYTADVREEDGVLWGQVRELPGCFGTGDTPDTLRESLEAAVRATVGGSR
jgi:predicted RNase H-like HicB family nuclease